MTRADQLQALHDAIEAGEWDSTKAQVCFPPHQRSADAPFTDERFTTLRLACETRGIHKEGAAIAFQQAVAPECGWVVDDHCRARIWEQNPPRPHPWAEHPSSPAIALVLATLRYLIEKE
jgi:hypothetical protein